MASLPLIIVKGKDPNLLGRNWMQDLKLKEEEGRIQQKELISKYQKAFKEETGLLEGATASIAVRSDSALRFFQA